MTLCTRSALDWSVRNLSAYSSIRQNIYICMQTYICVHTHTHTHTFIYIYGDMNPYTLVLTSFFSIVSVTVDEQSVGRNVLVTLLNIYVGYTETICRES